MPDAPPPSRAAATPRRDWRDEVSAEDWAEMPQGKRAEFVPDKAMDPDDVVGAAGRFLRQLTSADRTAFVGAAAMFLACFFPWKETVQDGEVLGLLSSGVVVFILSFGAMAAIVARVQQALPRTNPLILWAAQLGGLGLAELWSLIYVRVAWDSTEVMAPIGNYTMWVSKPTLGVVTALAGGVVAILGTVAGLRTPPA